MNNSHATYWIQVLNVLNTKPHGEVLKLSKHTAIHPESAGARRSLGLPMGQQADYRWVMGDCRGLHVRDFNSHYEAHIDSIDPSCDLVEHVRSDAPGTYVLGSAAFGALLGAMLGGRDAVLAGAAIGAAVGAITSKEKE